MADRFRNYDEPRENYPYLRDWDNSGSARDYSGRDYTYSSARDYAAAGEYGSGRDRGGSQRSYSGQRGYDSERGYNSGGGMGWRGDDYRGGGRSNWDREQNRGSYGRSQNRDYDYDRSRGGRDEDRGFFDRAGDEIRSWFGDEEAERRREQDMRESDRHYSSWRNRQLADFDRDYHEYRNENAQKFENEFGAWRTERQGQRTALQRVQEHMEVLGSDGQHIGVVDKVRGDRIVLTKADTDAGGHHHSIPSRWIESVDDKVTIRKTADEAKKHWRDEERSGAMFGDKGSDDNRSDYYRSTWAAI